MTEETEQEPVVELPGLEAPAMEAPAGEAESAFDSVDATMSASIPRISDIGLEDVGDAANWAWRHTLGYKREKAPEPGGISIDIPTEEETTIRSSSVAYEDPPPPPPETVQHEPEHASNDPHKPQGGH